MYPPKLGDKNLTGIQPRASEFIGIAAAPERTVIAIMRRRFNLTPW
jgi:hypothetical protein